MEIKTAGEINIEIASRYNNGEEWDKIRKEKYVTVKSVIEKLDEIEHHFHRDWNDTRWEELFDELKEELSKQDRW